MKVIHVSSYLLSIVKSGIVLGAVDGAQLSYTLWNSQHVICLCLTICIWVTSNLKIKYRIMQHFIWAYTEKCTGCGILTERLQIRSTSFKCPSSLLMSS